MVKPSNNTAPTKPLRLGIVGLGWVARDYMLPAVAEVEGVELVAVCDVTQPPANLLPDNVELYSDVAAMLTAARLDAVYIATPNHLHAEQAIACLEAGVAVLCEKPMAPTAAQSARIAEVVHASGTTYATAFDQRYHPAHVRAAELVREGALGTLTQLRLDYACWLPGNWSPTAAQGGAPAPDNWRIDRARAGGGAVIDLAPHGLDLVEMISGQRITELVGRYQSAVHDYTVDDGGAMVGCLEKGALLAHTVGYNRPESLPRRRLEIIGTEGMLLAENTMGQTAGGSLTLYPRSGGDARSVGFDESRQPFTAQLQAFVRLVATGEAVHAGRSVDDDVRLAYLLENAFPKPVATQRTS